MKWIHRAMHQQVPVAYWTFGICLFTLVAYNNDVTGESSHTSQALYDGHKTSSSQQHVGQDTRHIHPETKSAVLPWDVNNLEQPIEEETETNKQTRQSRSLHQKGQEKSSNKNVQGSPKGDKKSSKKPRNSSQLNESDRSGSSSKGPKGKSHESKSHRHYMESDTSGLLPDDLPSLQEKTLSLGKLVLEFLRQEVLPRLPGELSGSMGSVRSQERSLPFAETFASLFSKPVKRQGNENDGGGVINRNQAIGWLARLIGVDGKTLGEFLREYQVHVLYDLVFTFFKWIFFLYAGLLIP